MPKWMRRTVDSKWTRIPDPNDASEVLEKPNLVCDVYAVARTLARSGTTAGGVFEAPRRQRAFGHDNMTCRMSDYSEEAARLFRLALESERFVERPAWYLPASTFMRRRYSW